MLPNFNKMYKKITEVGQRYLLLVVRWKSWSPPRKSCFPPRECLVLPHAQQQLHLKVHFVAGLSAENVPKPLLASWSPGQPAVAAGVAQWCSLADICLLPLEAPPCTFGRQIVSQSWRRVVETWEKSAIWAGTWWICWGSWSLCWEGTCWWDGYHCSQHAWGCFGLESWIDTDKSGDITHRLYCWAEHTSQVAVCVWNLQSL